MKKSNLIILGVLVLGSIALFYFKGQDQTSNLVITADFFQVKDTHTVTKIFVTDIERNSITLERKNHYWLVNGKYRADKNSISNLFEPLVKIRVKAPVGDADKNEMIKEMTIGTQKVEIYKGDKLDRTLYVGNATADGLGTYIFADDDGLDRPYIVNIPGWNGNIGPRFFTKEMAWRSKRVFNFSPIQIKNLTVDYKNEPQASFKLENLDGGNVNVLPIYPVQDSIKNPKSLIVKQTLMSTASLYYEDFILPGALGKIDSIINVLPAFATIEIENKSGAKMNLILKVQPTEDDQSDVTGGLMIDRYYAYLANTDKPVIGLLQMQMASKLLKNYDRFENPN